VGGFLSRPAVSFPGVFGGGLLERQPYLLPCLASSAFAAVGLVVTIKFLPEIPRDAAPAPAPALAVAADAASGGEVKARGAEEGGGGAKPMGPWRYVLWHRRCRLILGIYFTISFLDCESATDRTSSSASSSTLRLPAAPAPRSLQTPRSPLPARAPALGFALLMRARPPPPRPDGMFEIYPLWAITAVRAGGLGWEPSQVGPPVCSGSPTALQRLSNGSPTALQRLSNGSPTAL
jgi:hypothetical protein